MSSDQKENLSLIILEGLLASIALGQLAGGGPDWQMAASMGGLLAIVTAVAHRMGRPVADVAGWCFGGIGLIALLPALLRLGGTNCGGGLGAGQQFALVFVFSGTWLTVGVCARLAVKDLPGILKEVSHLPCIPLSCVGIIEAVQFWSEPQPWTAFGDGQVNLLVAFAAAFVCGLAVGIHPAVGMALIGTALGLTALLSYTTTTTNCASPHTDSSVSLMLTFLVVLLITRGGISLFGKVLGR
ncbi:MAG: hypothetical protein WAV90_07630 [Gordonia amarae]